MQVTNARNPFQSHRPAAGAAEAAEIDRREAPGEEPADWFQPVRDLGVVGRLLSLGLLYKGKNAARKKANAEKPPLLAEPPVTLQDPVVFVPGWTTTREAFDPLAEKLLEGGRNGGQLIFVSEGKFYMDRECTELCDGDALQSSKPKVFEVVYSDIRLAPDRSSEELAVNFKAIKGLTGTQKVDVSAFSMGGLATRAYLDKGGQDIDQLLFVATPHQGAKFADLARRTLRRDIGWAIKLAGLLPADLPALDWLAPVEDGNPQLKQLNERWEIQKSRVNETHFVAGKGTVTARDGWWLIADGDGLVSVGSSAPPGEKSVVFDDQTHGTMNNSVPVFREMMDFFHWKAEELK
ncbi:MAG: hypothetical protein WC314_27900 [Vulcanimicrobiota bacterium]